MALTGCQISNYQYTYNYHPPPTASKDKQHLQFDNTQNEQVTLQSITRDLKVGISHVGTPTNICHTCQIERKFGTFDIPSTIDHKDQAVAVRNTINQNTTQNTIRISVHSTRQSGFKEDWGKMNLNELQPCFVCHAREDSRTLQHHFHHHHYHVHMM